MSALAGHWWIAVEQDGEEWPLAYVPYLELESSPAPSGAIDPFLVGNDGCNWYSMSGSLDGDRAAITHGTQTAMDCGPGTGAVVPANGDRLSVSNDGTRLEVYDDGGAPRLVFTALDSIPPATPAVLAGRWLLDSTAPSPVEFGQDGNVAFGPCTWSWALDDRLAVSDLGAEPYSCLAGSADYTSSRLVEMFEIGPVSARTDGAGNLYLADDQFVIRLRPSDVSPAEAQLPDDDQALADCTAITAVELISVEDSAPMDLVFYEHMTSTCGYNADGDAMFDDSFRPATAVETASGELRIAAPGSGAVSVDIRSLEPGTRLAGIRPSADVLTIDSAGTYPISIPGNGCFVITVGWIAGERSAQFTGLAESSAGLCGAA